MFRGARGVGEDGSGVWPSLIFLVLLCRVSSLWEREVWELIREVCLTTTTSFYNTSNIKFSTNQVITKSIVPSVISTAKYGQSLSTPQPIQSYITAWLTKNGLRVYSLIHFTWSAPSLAKRSATPLASQNIRFSLTSHCLIRRSLQSKTTIDFPIEGLDWEVRRSITIVEYVSK